MKWLLGIAALSFLALVTLDLNAETPPAPDASAPGAAAIPELGALEAVYTREVRDKVDAPAQASRQRLNESYRATLEATFKKTAAQGLLDETVALQGELKRFTADPKVPDADEPGTHPSVAKLRTFWRAETARIAKAHDAALQPLTASHVASLRTLASELTKSLKLDEARVVQAKANAFSAPAGPVATTPPPVAVVPPTQPAPAATPSTAPAVGEVLATTGTRPPDRIDLYATAVRSAWVYINTKEVLKDVGEHSASKARVALKEGDVIAVKNTDPNVANNMLYLSAVAATGEFLFESTEEWHSYIPKDHAKWWDIKNIKEEQNVQPMSKDQFLPFVQRCAYRTPYYRGTPPIHNVLHDESSPKLPNYCYHVVTKQDLLPKKLAPIPNPAVTLSAPFLGKTVRIKTMKGGTEGVVGTDQLTIAEFDPKNPKAGDFKMAKGDDVGSVVFESVEKPGLFIRHDSGKLHLGKGKDKTSQFELMPPGEGEPGVYILSLSANYFWQVNDKKELIHGGYRRPSGILSIEEVSPAK